MELNNQATLELTATLWLAVSKGETKINTLHKLGFGSWDFLYNCPLCERVSDAGVAPNCGLGNKWTCKGLCLLESLWPKGCEVSGPYQEWKTALFTRDYLGREDAALKIARTAGTLAGTWPPVPVS